MDQAVDIAYEAVFINGGQTCCAGTRTFVQDTIYDKFVRKAAERAAKRKVGDPFTDGVEQGPQVLSCNVVFEQRWLTSLQFT